MTATATLPTMDELTEQYKIAQQIPEIIDALALQCADVAWDVRQKAANVYTRASVGYYYNPMDEHLGLHLNEHCFTDSDFALCKQAASRVLSVREQPLTDAEAGNGVWIKVAYSPVVRSVGEFTNFFPGSNIVPGVDFHGPVPSMLTSGLIGAGLGYGAGWLGEKLLPEKWKKGRLSKTLAMLGAGIGVAPGMAYGMTNMMSGRNFWDNDLANHPASNTYDYNQQHRDDWRSMLKSSEYVELGQMRKTAIANFCKQWGQASDEMLKEAFSDTGAYGFQPGPRRQRSFLDVNVDAMGRLLWDTGATPQTTAMTMGALHAASQMPSRHSRPGWVTPGQMARVAVNMGAGYISGALVGGALGLLTGMPAQTQNTLKRTGMWLGMVNSVVPRLFGQ